jgi:hypothetical protein
MKGQPGNKRTAIVPTLSEEARARAGVYQMITEGLGEVGSCRKRRDFLFDLGHGMILVCNTSTSTHSE